MKKIILLLAVGAFFISSNSNAQQFIASFGVSQTWSIPQTAYHTINHDFYGYDVVHARRIINRGYASFDLILQRGDVFVEVHLGANGRVIGRTYLDYYPLASHVCNGYCGFHRTYYNTHRTVCSSNHHHGHNHVVYNRTRPVNVVYRNGNGRYGNHPGRGNAYGHYKGNNGRGNAYGHDKGNRGRGNAYGHDKGNRGRGNAYGHDKGNRGRGNAYGHDKGNRGRGNDKSNRGKGYNKNKNGRSSSGSGVSSGRRGRSYTSSRGN